VLRLSIRKEERGNIWDGGGSSQCRRGLPSLTLFFEMTLNCFPQKLGPIKQHLKTR
jgi:hypothetical protein